jgi:hypothetical protein
MSQDKEPEEEEEVEELQLPQTDTMKYLEDLINQIENQLPQGINYVTGIIVDDDMDLIIIKNGKLYIGKDENNAVEIRKYAEEGNPAYIINGLYILREMLPSYKEFWSGELERKAKKAVRDII